MPETWTTLLPVIVAYFDVEWVKFVVDVLCCAVFSGRKKVKLSWTEVTLCTTVVPRLAGS